MSTVFRAVDASAGNGDGTLYCLQAMESAEEFLSTSTFKDADSSSSNILFGSTSCETISTSLKDKAHLEYCHKFAILAMEVISTSTMEVQASCKLSLV